MDKETTPAVACPVERRVRCYPLDVQNCSGDDGYAVMSKGHHDPAAFVAAAREWWGEELEGWEPPQHVWWRVVPDQTGEYHCNYHPAEPFSRGAFPATVMEQR